MEVKFVVDVVASDGGWRLTGTIEDEPVTFLQHVDTESEAHALAGRSGAGAFWSNDWLAAKEPLTLVAEAGSAIAAGMVGNLHDLGLHGATRDPQLARYWYERAAAQGDAMSAWNLGSMLQVLGDPEAVIWQRRVLALGFDLVDPASGG